MEDRNIKNNRKSLRLKNYNYSLPGAYFVTICTYHKKGILSDIINNEIELNQFGKIIENEWMKTAQIRNNVELDEYIIMPNHFHGILFIKSRGVLQYAPTTNKFHSPSQNIGSIIRGFKSATTKRINQLRNMPENPVWQRNYYEHVIRSENELNCIREYIKNNPLRWQYDKENPIGKPDKIEKDFWKNFV